MSGLATSLRYLGYTLNPTKLYYGVFVDGRLWAEFNSPEAAIEYESILRSYPVEIIRQFKKAMDLVK